MIGQVLTIVGVLAVVLAGYGLSRFLDKDKEDDE